MNPEEFIEILSGMPGVIRIAELTDDVISDLTRFEFSAPANGFLPVDPIGFNEVVESDISLIMFFDDHLASFEPEPFMYLVDSRGTVVGHDIILSEKHLYDSPEYIWLSDNMFFDMTKASGSEMRCLIKAARYRPECIPEDIRAKVFFPCTSSVEYLLDRFGYSDDTSVVLLGADGIEH